MTIRILRNRRLDTMVAILAAAFCGLFGFICGGGGMMKLYERKIKSGYIQVDDDIYEAKIILRGKEANRNG